MSDEESEDLDRLKQALDLLGEHYDSVHIFVSRHEPAIHDGTVSCNKGVGNWFARFGQIKLWVLNEEAHPGGSPCEEDD